MQLHDRSLAVCVVAALVACEGRPATPQAGEVAAVGETAPVPAVGETVPVAPAPVPAAAATAATGDRPADVVPAGTPPSEPAATPPVIDAPGRTVMHPILRHRSLVEVDAALDYEDWPRAVGTSLAVLADGQVLYMFDGRQFAVFPTGIAAVAEPPVLRDLPVDARAPAVLRDVESEGSADDRTYRIFDALGGRWPEAMFTTTTRGNTRSYDVPEVWRWAAEKWEEQPSNLLRDDEFELQWGYVRLLPWVDGGVLGVRDLVCGTDYFTCEPGQVGDDEPGKVEAPEPEPGEPGEADDEDDGPDYDRLIATARREFRVFKPLVVVHGSKTKLPKLPADGDSRRMHATASGDLFVPRPGAIEHWSVASNKWRTHPLPAGSATPTLVGPDPTNLYAVTCTDDKAGLARLVGEAFVAETLPASPCLGDLAVERGGTVWALHGNYFDPTMVDEDAHAVDPEPPNTELWRRPVGGAWERINLAPVQLAADAGEHWRSDGLRWRLSPPSGPVQPVPLAIEAIGPGDVFVQASTNNGDTLILRDRPLPATIVDLAPTQIAQYVYEGDNDECVPQHLVLTKAEQATPELLASLAGTPDLEVYEVPGTGVVAMLTGPPHAPAAKRAALQALRKRLLKLAPEASEPKCGLPAMPRRAHAIESP